MLRTIPKKVRYFRKIYENGWGVLDTARKTRGPEKVRIYDALQELAKLLGGEEWTENPFSKFWPFTCRAVEVAATGMERYEWSQIYIGDDDQNHETERGLIPKKDVRAAKKASRVFAQAKKELKAAALSNQIVLVGESVHRKFVFDDLKPDVIVRHHPNIFCSGAISYHELRDSTGYDPVTEGELIYLYVTAATFDRYLASRNNAQPPDRASFALAPPRRVRGARRDQRDAVLVSLKVLYPQSFPSDPVKTLMPKVNMWLKDNDFNFTVSAATVNRALLEWRAEITPQALSTNLQKSAK